MNSIDVESQGRSLKVTTDDEGCAWLQPMDQINDEPF